MQTTLKLKLKHALNNFNFADADSPALIVGGRRRNRKKRRPRNGQNRRKNKRGDINDSPAETPECSRKSFANLDYSETKQQKVSCLDIEEPVFAVSTKENTKENAVRNVSSREENLIFEQAQTEGEEIHEEKDVELEGFLAVEVTNLYNLTEACENETRQTMPRHHSEDSGVFDDENDWTQLNLGTLDDDSALSDNEEVPEYISSEEREQCAPLQITEIVHDELSRNDKELTYKDTLEKVPTEDCDHGEDNDKEDVIFDRTNLKEKILKTSDGEISPIDNNNRFQLKSVLNEPTELEDGMPQQIPLDLLSDDEDDVVLFDAGSRSEPGIICNPLYEQTLKEEHEATYVRSYQVGFKPDFDAVNFIRLPTTDKAAKKEMKESSPLIRKQSGDELPCCIIL